MGLSLPVWGACRQTVHASSLSAAQCVIPRLPFDANGDGPTLATMATALDAATSTGRFAVTFPTLVQVLTYISLCRAWILGGYVRLLTPF